MKALILAAGQGNRLGFKKPKALVTVAGQELLAYQLEWLRSAKIKKIGVVAGYQAPLLKDFIQTQNPKVEIFENPNFLEGNILSLQVALPFFDDDCLLMNVDHIYPKQLLGHFLEQTNGITAACDFDRPLVADDMKVLLNAQGSLEAIDKTLKKYEAGYIGMTFCPRAKIKTYREGFKKTLATFGPKSSVEKILGVLAENREPIAIADLSGTPWLEIDTPEDLKRGEEKLRENSKFLD